MADYIRRIVSGNKARFKDSKLNLELDLVYVTDQIIIMGYPAVGMEGFYRNRREDAKRFLEHRHGKNYWVFNFCPIKENSYEASVFDGRVSRYPFPDHHAPPLAIMPLLAREMRAWLSGSPERVAVLHCKAGKGRSGTMACTYLLSLDDEPTPPKLEQNYSKKEWAKIRTENTMDSLPDDSSESHDVAAKKHSLSPVFETSKPDFDTVGILDAQETGSPPLEILNSSPVPDGHINHEKSFTSSLKGVLDLHTARRMKSPSEGKKVKQGVSIPSQRRWLNYWALILAHEAPLHLWISKPSPQLVGPEHGNAKPMVRLTEIKLRMHETSGVKKSILRAANIVIDRAKDTKSLTVNGKNGNSANHVWASLARYDDNLVETLERWEVYTRDEKGRMGHRRKGSEHMAFEDKDQERELSKLFAGGDWDTGKMVRGFARLGEDESHEDHTADGDIIAYTLRPLSDKRWENIQDGLNMMKSNAKDGNHVDVEALDIPKSEVNSVYDLTSGSMRERERQVKRGIILDASREVRVKLYMGQVFMGWLWLIPTFHMSQPPPSTSQAPVQSTSEMLMFTRTDLDFPVGIGADIIDVQIKLEWVTPEDVKSAPEPDMEIEPPARAHLGTHSIALAIVGGAGEEGSGGLREAVEAKQGEEQT
ncbi:hypothetical protein BDQ17DRAFT_1361279 [Cyathus striatus]|nr:hypothetical protein BDQ17DRAFT_1361279 [Cyathus striatus]